METVADIEKQIKLAENRVIELSAKKEKLKKELEQLEEVAAFKVYVVYENSDTTEGRGPMVPMKNGIFTTEQAAWDSINDKGGIMGRHPSNWGDKPKTWQQYQRDHGYADYQVKEELVFNNAHYRKA